MNHPHTPTSNTKQDREVQALKRKLETMQHKLEEKGYLATADNTARAVAAKERVVEAESFADLVAMSKSLDRKIEKLEANTGGPDLDSSTTARRSKQVSEAHSLGGRGGLGL